MTFDLALVSRLPALLATSLVLAGCPDDEEEGPPTCLPGCAASRDYDALAYRLAARFDWDAARLEAVEEITLSFPAGVPRVVELDAAEAMEVEDVRAGEQRLGFSREGDRLRVDLTGLAVADDTPVSFSVTYQAGTSNALVVPAPRDDDPVRARVVYSNSEPDRGVAWLVAKHDPSDRARWTIALDVADDEDVIANGRRASDVDAGDRHVVTYEMDDPLPTYLMAFAAGQLAHTDRAGDLPLSIWHRQGAVVDTEAHLDVIADQMARFEALLGPYPFASYAVVLLPGFPGGMENATVTFNSEASGQGNISYGLNAHELGHHWFGDWVTMRTYDDAWIKEGMATLLAAEAQRGTRDTAAGGRFFGYDFTFDPADSIVNRSLVGLDKYTSGPYERAAWLLTQIRVTLGEEVFWATLRDVLDAHALGSLDGETFLRSFPLPEARIEELVGLLEDATVPTLGITSAANPVEPTSTDVTFTLSHNGALFAPFEVTVVDADGQATVTTLQNGQPSTLTVPAGGYLAPDERDIHPYWAYSWNLDSESFYEAVVPLFVPSAPAALEAYLARSASHQERSADFEVSPAIEASGLAAFEDGLDSDLAQRDAVLGACQQIAGLLAEGSPEGAALWREAVRPLLATPEVGSFTTAYASCGPELGRETFATELATLDDADVARIEYLLGFDYGADSLALLEPFAASGSIRLRDQVLTRLSRQADASSGYSDVPVEQVPAWAAFFRARIATTTSPGRFRAVWLGLVNLGDTAGLVQAAPLLHSVELGENGRFDAVCQAYFGLSSQPGGFADVAAAAQPWDELGPDAAAALADPVNTCE